MSDGQPSPARRRVSPAQIMGAIMVLSLILGGVIGFFIVQDGGYGPQSRTAFVWGFLAVLLAACAVTIPYWRRLDEAAREAHKFAWMWGGGAGFTLAAAGAALLLLAPADIGLPSLAHRLDGPGRFADGVFLTLGLQSIAYGVVWLVWWQRRR